MKKKFLLSLGLLASITPLFSLAEGGSRLVVEFGGAALLATATYQGYKHKKGQIPLTAACVAVAPYLIGKAFVSDNPLRRLAAQEPLSALALGTGLVLALPVSALMLYRRQQGKSE
ncbi:MAG TPA: hypothetical protein QGF02_01105 [Candidatus Babeliales bacterium]|nr:hypothetical protein [Candidatus Babeliales bacterium]